MNRFLSSSGMLLGIQDEPTAWCRYMLVHFPLPANVMPVKLVLRDGSEHVVGKMIPAFFETAFCGLSPGS